MRHADAMIETERNLDAWNVLALHYENTFARDAGSRVLELFNGMRWKNGLPWVQRSYGVWKLPIRNPRSSVELDICVPGLINDLLALERVSEAADFVASKPFILKHS
jgi:hypothetical protein